MTFTVPDYLMAQLEPYREQLGDLLRIGLREMKMLKHLSYSSKGTYHDGKQRVLPGSRFVK